MSNMGDNDDLFEYMFKLLQADPDRGDSTVDPVVRRAAEKMQEFIDEIPGGFLIYRATEGEHIIHANKALLNIFKCDDLGQFIELTGGSFRGVVHPDDIDRVEREIAEQITFGDNHDDYVEYRITRRDGEVRWVEDYGHYFSSDTEDDAFFYVFITDATDKIARHIQASAALLNDKTDSEKLLRSTIAEYNKERKMIRQEHLQRLEVIEGLSINYDSILYADIDNNIVLPYRLSSRLKHQFTKRMEQRALDWFLKEYVDVWVHPDDRSRVAQCTSIDYIRNRIRADGTFYINYRCIQDGEIQYIQLRIVNVGGKNHVSQLVMGYRNIDDEVLQDMQQKKLLQDALRKAKVAEIAKNTFLSNMSHDMRTPLNAIFGYVRLAHKTVSDDATRDCLDKIESAADCILDLVDKVLELTYTEAQELCLSEAPCSLRDVVSDVYNGISRQAEQKGVSVTVDTDGIVHDSVSADKAKLVQALTHIASNAVKYTPRGGKAIISVSEQRGSVNDFATFVFTVADNGIGIAPDHIDRIFEPFERASNTTQSGEYGTGLGLTITKHLVEIMGGNIAVKSALGKGSVFTVTVGLKLLQSTGFAPAEEKFDLTGKRLLVVEDNLINLEIETELLEDAGFIVDSAENGKIAVDKIAASKPGDYDVVLMDIQMPVMDGRAAAAAIRRLDDKMLASIPIIALSANAFESDKRESLAAGMNDHLNKPVDMDVLSETIRRILCNE